MVLEYNSVVRWSIRSVAAASGGRRGKTDKIGSRFLYLPDIIPKPQISFSTYGLQHDSKIGPYSTLQQQWSVMHLAYAS